MSAPEATDLRVCERCDEPLVFTMEFPGAEYVCMGCGALEDIFGRRATATAALRQRHDELVEKYGRERAERRGLDFRPDPKVGDRGVTAPVCNGCGSEPPLGTALSNGKPHGWFSRQRDGHAEYACSRSCIPATEAVLPW